VNVIVKGTAIGVVTDFDGNYTISIPEVDEKTTLSFIFIGFKTVDQVVNGRTTINVSLEEDVALLDEIVVIGYGTQIEKKVTGAIQSISGNDFQELPAAQITQKMQGRLAGVQINQSTGAPGEALKVRIRGQISLSAGSDPLYVIDGQPITG
ncbi:MAG: carboxypeptidase-like regulatory domain-containing protein, partial [Flavobacteriaceae bacterium]